jgi:hypothetical protein
MRWAEDGRNGTVVVVAVAATLLYVASRSAAAALGGRGAARPGWRAVGHWLPIAATALVAAARGQADIAVALTFATTVCCLSFILGVLLYLSPMDTLPASRKAWPFVLPAALLSLIAGFSGHVGWVHALAMLLLGGALLSVWRDPALQEPAPVASPFSDGSAAPAPVSRTGYRAAELALAAALAIIGGWYAVSGTVRAAAAAHLFPAATLAVVILSPLVTLPMLNPAPADAPAGETGSAVSTLVAVATLNLCALVPLLTIVWLARTAFVDPAPAPPTAEVTAATRPATTTTTAAAGITTSRAAPAALEPLSFSARLDRASPLPFPLPTWRVDAVVLTVLGFVLIPVSLGRWELRRTESVGLIIGYAVYLVLVAFASVRW